VPKAAKSSNASDAYTGDVGQGPFSISCYSTNDCIASVHYGAFNNIWTVQYVQSLYVIKVYGV
jgi:hypothetical protein